MKLRNASEGRHSSSSSGAAAADGPAANQRHDAASQARSRRESDSCASPGSAASSPFRTGLHFGADAPPAAVGV